MSVLERSNYWLEKKAKHIETLTEESEQAEMKDCTFRPVCYARLSQVYEQYMPMKLNRASIFQSQNGSRWESVLSEPKTAFYAGESIMQGDYSPISPYKVNVGFSAGCDVRNFLTRSSANQDLI